MLIAEPTRVIARGRLPVGAAGTRRTLELMRVLVEQGARDPAVRDAALSILRMAQVAGHDFLGELKALYAFVRDRIRYTRDPLNVETLQTPATTLRLGAGDCDDQATLLAALLRAVGHPAQLAFRVIGLNPRAPGAFSHVYVVARLGRTRIPLDPTWTGLKAGWEYPRPVAVGGMAL